MLWRHGQTVWNVQGRFQGQTDIPLDETGLEQAERSARRLASLTPEAIVSSDLRRTRDTALLLSHLAGVPPIFDADLRERSMGAWEGLTHDEVAQRFPGEWRERQPVSGETYEQVAERVAAAAGRALEKVSNDGTLVLVTHGAALRAGMASILELPVEHWSRIGPVANCCWSILGEGHSGWRLFEHNAGSLPEPVYSDDR